MRKTHSMLFTRSRNYDFPPELAFLDGTSVNVVSETCLLAVIISDDLEWGKNTSFICLKARRKLWTLKRMKLLHLNEFELFDVYPKRCAENPKWNYISRNVRKIRNGTAFPFRYIRVCRDSLDNYVQLFTCVHRVSMWPRIEKRNSSEQI